MKDTTGMQAQESSRRLERRLRRTRRRMLALGSLGGAFAVWSLSGWGALAVFGADRLTKFPEALRFIVTAAFIVVSVSRLYVRVIAVFLRGTDRAGAARRLEERFPHLGGFALSAAELSPASRRSSAPSDELVELTVVEAASRVDRIPEGAATGLSAVRGPFLLATAAALVWAAVALGFPSDTAAFLHRFAHPFSRYPYPSRTRIVSVEAPGIVALGDGFKAEVVAEGVLPEEAVFHVSPDKGPRRRMTSAGVEGRYVLELATVRDGFGFYVEVGDAESGEFQVIAVARPAIDGLEARVSYPSYTQTEDLTVPGGNLSVLGGSRAEVAAKFNKPVKSASLEFDGGAVVEGELDEGASGAVFRFEVTETTHYRMRLVDLHGFEPLERPVFSVVAETDRPPMVALEGPARDLTCVPEAVVPVRVSVSDDYGVVSVALKYEIRRGNGASTSQESLFAQEAPLRGGVIEHDWRLSDLALSAGDEVAYYLEALDNVPGGAQPGRSDTFTVKVVTVAEKLAEIERLNLRIQANLKEVALRQKTARDSLAAAVLAEETK